MKVKKRSYTMTQRALQVEQTREKVLESAADACMSGDFTLEKIASEAGVSERTVLRLFGSKDQLRVAALTAGGRKGKVRPVSAGDVSSTLDYLYSEYEVIGDSVIASLADEHRIPGLQEFMAYGREYHKGWVAASFAPQLASQRGQKRAELLQALIVATDVYTWKILRRDQKLSTEAAQAVARRLIDSLIQTEGE